MNREIGWDMASGPDHAVLVDATNPKAYRTVLTPTEPPAAIVADVRRGVTLPED